jgi:hypothetical protein
MAYETPWFHYKVKANNYEIPGVKKSGTGMFSRKKLQTKNRSVLTRNQREYLYIKRGSKSHNGYGRIIRP